MDGDGIVATVPLISRNAISTLYNVLCDALWQCLVARDAVNHRSDFALTKAVERKGNDRMRSCEILRGFPHKILAPVSPSGAFLRPVGMQ
jgi:hypothetical protein